MTGSTSGGVAGTTVGGAENVSPTARWSSPSVVCPVSLGSAAVMTPSPPDVRTTMLPAQTASAPGRGAARPLSVAVPSAASGSVARPHR